MRVETVFLSCKLQKFNMFSFKQERNIVLTEQHLYLFNGKSKFIVPYDLELRRKVELINVIGVTLSKHKDSNEFVIHIINEEDLRLKSGK